MRQKGKPGGRPGNGRGDGILVLLFILAALSAFLLLRLPTILSWSPLDYDEVFIYDNGRSTTEIGSSPTAVNSYIYATSFQIGALFEDLFRDLGPPLARARMQAIATTALAFVFLAMFSLKSGAVPRKTGALAALLYLFLPANFFLAGMGSLLEVTTTLFIALTLFCWMLYRRSKDRRLLFLLAFVAASGASAKLVYLLFLFPFLACAFLFGELKGLRGADWAIVGAAVLAACLHVLFYLESLVQLPLYLPRTEEAVVTSWAGRLAQVSDVARYFLPLPRSIPIFVSGMPPISGRSLSLAAGFALELLFACLLARAALDRKAPAMQRFLCALAALSIAFLFVPMPGPKIYQAMTTFPACALALAILFSRAGRLRAFAGLLVLCAAVCVIFSFALDLPPEWKGIDTTEDGAFYYEENLRGTKMAFLTREDPDFFGFYLQGRMPGYVPFVDNFVTSKHAVLDPVWRARLSGTGERTAVYIRKGEYASIGPEGARWRKVKEIGDHAWLLLGPYRREAGSAP